MSISDRIARSLFVGLAVGLGWGIRGDFGHLLGAMFPGAALGLAFAYATGQKSAFKWAPLLGAAGGLGISLGGAMSYGILHGYSKSDTFLNYSYGFFTLILQGGAWGCFGAVLIGLLLDKRPLKATEAASLVGTVYLSGMTVYALVVDLIGFHINPPRSDLSIGYTGGVIGLFVWLVLNKRWIGFRGAFFGYVGFGLAMSFGRLLGNASYLQPAAINTWNVMETMCGVIGGFVFAFGMLGVRLPDPPEEEGPPFLVVGSSIYILGLIPLLHRLYRISGENRMEQWITWLTNYKYADPELLAQRILLAIDIICILGFVCAAIWIYALIKDRSRWKPLPLLALCGAMLLIQNLNVVYFFYPRQEGSINMHFIFWVLYVLIVLFTFLYPFREAVSTDEEMERTPWKPWLAAAVGMYLFIIIAAGFVNGEETMTSANTRWPIWVWRDGPFPGR